ncbi:ABC transporter B family member 26, chloroplastic isoform X1 [Lactuca sativa]|uniref:ABC transporter B family member 26, chloroplastic isoform X1 n=1 Tax=Lactuca sativa TaxID=4236 RepID=UPI000CBE9214|nr:ABC transporter B family member 26, chloroplastic isoform X1 [Lactuca sativa]
MTLILNNHHHRHPSFIYSNIHSKKFNFTTKLGVKYSCRRANRRLVFTPVNSASVNGYSLRNNDSSPEVSDGVGTDYGEDNAIGVSERLLRFVRLVSSVLPGGNWWRFSDEVEVSVTAKPVTLVRALRRMWGLIANDRWVIFAAFSALILTALTEISIPHFLTASIFSAQSGETAVFQGNVKLLMFLCITSGICSGLRGCWFGIANMILVKRMRETLYSILLLQDINFFDSESIGDLTSRLGSDCQQVSRVIGNDLNLILRNLLQATGALIYLLVLSWPLGLCTLAICSTLSLVMLKYGQYQKKAAKLTQEFTASANEVAQETFSLMRTVRVYGTEHKELERYTTWLEKLADISLRTSGAYGIWNFSFNTLYHSTQVLAVLVGGMSIMAGKITAEQLTKFILYSEWLIYSTWFVGDNLSNLMQSVGASEKVFQMMDLAPSQQFTSKGSKLPNLKGLIEFVNVSFSYTSRETVHVLKDISITVNPYEVVALVGLSGSGKSTIVNLLLRLYEPTSGQILIDGHPLNNMDIKWLRERIGYVGQEPRLFRMDVRSNIAYGCTRDVSEEEIEDAAKQAYAHDFISCLPEGYNTIVDDDLLSGGQKQRIAIARAVLRDPSILILDEATSALDAESEYNVKGVLRADGDKCKRTVIIIAHRLSTIQAADRIIVMDSGRIIEMGNHKQLLLKDGLYARLTRRQVDSV